MPEVQWLPHWDAYRTQDEDREEAARVAIFNANLHFTPPQADKIMPVDPLLELDREMTALGIEGDSENKRTPPQGVNVGPLVTERWYGIQNNNGDQTDGT